MTQPHPDHPLLPGDADALDALIDAGLRVERVSVVHRAKAAQIFNILALVDTPIQVDQDQSTLVDVTMARVLRAASPADEGEAVLTAMDGEALDAYVAADFRTAKVPALLRPRAFKIEAMVNLVSQTPTNTPPAFALTERTMRRIALAEREQEASQSDSGSLRPVGGFRFADLVSVAAVILLGVAVMWPVLTTVRGYQQRAGCASNLGRVATAMGEYSGDFSGMLPMATASYGGTWLDVGSSPERSNSANLFTLPRFKYASMHDLACSGNPNAVVKQPSQAAQDWSSLKEVSYSYYIMFGKARPTPESSPSTIILADKSPVVMRASTKQVVRFPLENSPNHAGKGQWALRADGAAVWLTTPQVGSDNIWLSRGHERIWSQIQAHLPQIEAELRSGVRRGVLHIPVQGDELPESAADSFLGP
jgi:hypothetical protein